MPIIFAQYAYFDEAPEIEKFVTVGSNIAFVDFADLTFSSVTLSAVGALIYKSGGSNEAVLVLDFGGTKTATNGDFVVQFPTASSSAAIIRLGNA